MVKIIDKYVLKAFVGPFIVSFGIAIFVLVMQTIFIYLDEIIGKGASIFIIMELVFYLSIRLFPLAFLIGILLGSVMVFGNLGERYELSSFKSAGISLARIMRPLMVLVFFISILSYICNDILSPRASSKFWARLYDIRQARPALALVPGTFNGDFLDYSIFLHDKSSNAQDISDVLVYNQARYGNLLEVSSSARGNLQLTPDKQYLVMTLEDGIQYHEEARSVNNNGQYSQPFFTVSYKSYRKAFDLSPFGVKSTDPELFKSHQYMKTSKMLRNDIDTLDNSLANLAQPLTKSLSFLYKDLVSERDSQQAYEIAKLLLDTAETDTIVHEKLIKDTPVVDSRPAPTPTSERMSSSDSLIMARLMQRKGIAPRSKKLQNAKLPEKVFIPTIDNSNNYQVPTLDSSSWMAGSYERYFYEFDRKSILQTAITSVNENRIKLTTLQHEVHSMSESRAKHIYEWQSKYVLSLACLIFLLIGAPMGAIVRKGGFGYPFLVSVLFFATFVILSIATRKMAEGLVLNPFIAAWLPLFIMLGIGLFLSYKAMRDSKLFNVDQLIKQWSERFQVWFEKF